MEEARLKNTSSSQTHTTLNHMDISGAYGHAHQSSKTIKKARKEMVT